MARSGFIRDVQSQRNARDEESKAYRRWSATQESEVYSVSTLSSSYKATSKHWLMKSEAEVYSIDDLARDKTTLWDGVRNYQARNFLRDSIQKGDRVFFYHSNAAPSGIAGVAEVVCAGYPDPSAFRPKDVHFDPKSTPEKPVWFAVDIRFVKKFPRLLSLEELKKNKSLQSMVLLKRGRLSVQPVTQAEWAAITEMALKGGAA